MDRLRASTLLRLAALVVLVGLAGALTFGYLGRIHPALDSFSHFRVHIAAGLVLLALPLLALRFRPEALFAVALGATAIIQTTGLPVPARFSAVTESAADQEPPGAVYRLLQINLRYDNRTPEAALSLIGRLKPDIVTLNEVSTHWRQRLASLEKSYPYSVFCPSPAYIGGAAILSRRPFAAGSEPWCGDRGAVGIARYDLGGRKVEVMAVHLGWPWPFDQPWQVPQLEPLLGEVGDTTIIAGDLNAAPWSHTVRTVAANSGTRILRGIGPTWLDRRLPVWMRPWIGLPLDNVLVKGGVLPVSLGTVDWVGSDHLPVLLEFMLLPQEEAAPVLQAALPRD